MDDLHVRQGGRVTGEHGPPSDGVTWHDGVTSDVIGASPRAPSLGTVLGIKNLAPAQDVDLPLAYP